jgi:hypothetical protein
VAPFHPLDECHVSTTDWPTSLPHVAATSLPYATSSLPRQLSVRSVSRHVTRATSSADVIHATCHPSSGDTCHFRIGPTVHQKLQNCLKRVSFRCCHVSCTDLPRVIVRTCHVSSPGAATSPVRTCHMSSYGPDTGPVRTYHVSHVWTCHVSIRTDCTDCTVSKVKIFACLARRTECDNFFTQTPFTIKIIPPESGR